MPQFISIIRKSKLALLCALVLSVLSGIASTALLALINHILTTPSNNVRALGTRFAVLAGFVVLSRTASGIFFVRLGQRAKAELRRWLTHKLADAPYVEVERQHVGEGTALLTQDMDAVVTLFVVLPTLVIDTSVLLGCLTYLGWLSLRVLALASLSILLGSAGFYGCHARALRELRGSRQREDGLIRHFGGLFAGAKELRLHISRKRAYVDEILGTGIEAVRAQRTRGYVLATLSVGWGHCVSLAFMGSVLFILPDLVFINDRSLSTYAVTFLYMTLPLGSVLSAVPNMLGARVALERIERVSSRFSSEASVATCAPAQFRSIQLQSVMHRYVSEHDDRIFTLGPLNLDFRAGELVFLIGGNGSGKTTLAKLLVGLYSPERGQILLDHQPLADGHYEMYRQQFSAVFSDFFLFESLVGLPATELDARAREYLVTLQLSDKVSITDGKLSTTALSLGQRKRLALLVACLEDRPFYVFDEWAADQDPAFKEAFYRRFLPDLKARGKTVLAITHDDRYFDAADRCIVLDHGQVVNCHTNTDIQPLDTYRFEPKAARGKRS